MPKVIGYTLQDPTIASITGVSFSRQSNGQGGSEFPVTVSYELKDAGGVVRKTGSIGFSATAAQVAGQSLTQLLATFDTLAAIKTLEGYDS